MCTSNILHCYPLPLALPLPPPPIKIMIVHIPSLALKITSFLKSPPSSRYFFSPSLTSLLKIVFQYASNKSKYLFHDKTKMMLPFKTFAKWKIYFRCTKQKIFAAQNRKYTLHKMENIRCTKRKIYAAQNGKYRLHKMENLRCTKRKIYAAQNRIYVTQKRIYMFRTK